MKHNFRRLEIWIQSMTIVEEVYQHISAFPIDERYGLKSQIARCSVSVPSNIAEGSGRTTDKEFAHFLDISLGSSFELETQLILAQKLFQIDTTELVEKCQNLQRMINGFKLKLLNKLGN